MAKRIFGASGRRFFGRDRLDDLGRRLRAGLPGCAFLELLAPSHASIGRVLEDCRFDGLLLAPELAGTPGPAVLLRDDSAPGRRRRVDAAQSEAPRTADAALSLFLRMAADFVCFAESGDAGAGKASDSAAGRPLVLAGPMAVGKSAVAESLAALSGRRAVDLDVLVEADAGADIPAIFEREGEAGFRRRESAALARALADDASIIATGGGAVLSANNRSLMRSRARVVWLHARPEILAARATGVSRPLLAGGDPLSRLAAIYADRLFLYAMTADWLLDTEELDARTAAEVIHDEIL
jgi:shikimate kinase